MAWKRRGANRYYYRQLREGDCVISTYIGAGAKGRQAEAEDVAERQAKQEKRRSKLATLKPLEQISQSLHVIQEVASILTTCTLLCQGWRSHHREWRPPKCPKQ